MSNNVATVANGSNIILITVPTPTSSRFQHRLKVLAPQSGPSNSSRLNMGQSLPQIAKSRNQHSVHQKR